MGTRNTLRKRETSHLRVLPDVPVERGPLGGFLSGPTPDCHYGPLARQSVAAHKVSDQAYPSRKDRTNSQDGGAEQQDGVPGYESSEG